MPELLILIPEDQFIFAQRPGKHAGKCSGFTLIEISTTLMVIGLMMGFMFKGQAQIDTAKVIMLGDDFRNTQEYIYGYQGKFNALPGDDPSIGSSHSHLNGAAPCPSTIIGKCVPGNHAIDGKWNDTTIDSESFLFWQQIRLAGFASGETDTTSPNYPAKNTVGGSLGVTNGGATPIAGLSGQYIICSDRIAGKYVKQLDLALDDGSTISGAMRATLSGTAADGIAIATSSIQDDSLYLVCLGS